MTEEKLKPCAHCGEKVLLGMNDLVLSIECSCGIKTPGIYIGITNHDQIYIKSINKLIKIWNRRSKG